MLKLRREHRDLFIHGEFVAYDLDGEETFVYSKHFDDERAVVVLNFTAETHLLEVPGEIDGSLQLMQSNAGMSQAEMLLPYEARVYLVGK